MGDEKILITGAMGCIGAWALKHLVDEGADVIATDLSEDPVRPRLLMTEAEIGRIRWMKLDVTDPKAVNDAVAANGVTRIIHLAGLQVPFSRANPPLGAQVNVTGTVNILEAARHNGVRGVCYASSLAALGPAEFYSEFPVPDDCLRAPTTLYGVYKAANEETARIYWQDWKVGSIGLRPQLVYGVARDQGMSSDFAKAILATAAGRPFHIRIDGPIGLQHASDVARMFIGCARAEHQGAAVFNIRNDVTTTDDFIALLTELYPEARITREKGAKLGLPADLSDAGLRGVLGDVPHIPLADAIRQDHEAYRKLIAEDRIDLTQLDR